MATSTLRERVLECERRNPGITRAQVARAAGVKPPSVTDWFNGKTVSLKLAAAVGAARLWGCDPLWLGEGVGTPNWQGGATDPLKDSPLLSDDGVEMALDIRDVMRYASSDRRRQVLEQLRMTLVEARERIGLERFGVLLDKVDHIERDVGPLREPPERAERND